MSSIDHLYKELQESLSYLVSDKGFLKKIWLLPLLLIIPFINVSVGRICTKGWQLQLIMDYVKDRGIQPIVFVDVFKKGLFLYVVIAFYCVVPAVLFKLIDVFGALLPGDSNKIESVIAGELNEWLAFFAFYTVWMFLISPLIYSGMIRYALSENVKDLFSIHKNIFFLIRNCRTFFKHFLFSMVIEFAYRILMFLMFVVLTNPVFFWLQFFIYPVFTVLTTSAVGYELGVLAKEIHEKNTLVKNGVNEYV